MLNELWFYKLVFEDTEYDYKNQFKPLYYATEDGYVSTLEDKDKNDTATPLVRNEGIEQILKLYNYFDTDQDTFLCYELGKKTLAKRLATVKYVRLNNEFCYIVKH